MSPIPNSPQHFDVRVYLYYRIKHIHVKHVKYRFIILLYRTMKQYCIDDNFYIYTVLPVEMQ